ncbi:MAG: response regulator transcription factor [Bacillota bacterium]|jgi:DNA-binding NarL/FixJ family response regulator
MVRVLVAFTNPDWQRTIRSILSRERSVKASYVELGDLNQQFSHGPFDVVYVQAGVNRTSLSQSLITVRKKYPGARLVLVVNNSGISDVVYGHRMGISAILDEDSTKDQVLSSLGAAVRGDLYLSSRVVRRSESFKSQNLDRALPSLSARKLGLLSDREMEVLKLVARGMANRVIAQSLFISEKTVKNHLYNIFKKIGVTDRTKAALLAINALPGAGYEAAGPVHALAQSD